MFRIALPALLLAAFALVGETAQAQESKAAQATRMKLKQKVTVDFKDIGTKAVFDEIKGEMEKPVNIRIDNASGVSNNTKITYKAKDKTVEQILNEISDKMEFGWVVISNPDNNKVDGWVVIRKSKERGYEAGKEPKKTSALPRGDFHTTSFVAGDAKLPLVYDFEDGAVGKLPPGWIAVESSKGEKSHWAIAEDKTAPKGSKVLFQMMQSPSSTFNLCVADKSSFGDLDVTVSFKAVAGKKDQGGGPVWRYKDADNYYVVRMNPLEDNFRLYKVVGGKRIQLATAEEIVAPSGKWHSIRVVHKGDHIQCFFNGKKHLDAKDAEFKDAGKVGLWTKADAQTYFDNLVIRKAE